LPDRIECPFATANRDREGAGLDGTEMVISFPYLSAILLCPRNFYLPFF